MKFALFIGCNIPARVSPYADATAAVFEKLDIGLVEVAEFNCCGAPLTGINDRLAMDMALKKLTSAREAGAHCLCIACPYTHLQFEWVQQRMATNTDNWEPVAPILYQQLLGLCMGIDKQTLGLSKSLFELTNITSFLMPE
jgi:heterodisulfide reductase subunit B